MLVYELLKYLNMWRTEEHSDKTLPELPAHWQR
jgi:hypothetical protein